MKIRKQHLDDMVRAYCASYMKVDGELNVLIASEEKGYPCYAYLGRDFNHRTTVWQEGGGCMSIIPIPGKPNEFLAVMDFYLKASPSEAKIVWGKYENNAWIIKDLVHLPYIHRFDLYRIDGLTYFVGATIADEKANKEDWSHPGSIYAAKLPNQPEEGLELIRIKTGLTRNHGYSRSIENGKTFGYFTSDEGVFKLTPESDISQWTFEQILDGPVGEIALADLDGDGVLELATIEPFHGNNIKVYHQCAEGYQVVYQYPHDVDFAHTLVGTTIRGVGTIVAGVRRMDCELFMIQCVDGQYASTLIEQGVGPANLAVVNEANRDIIVAANHTKYEAAVYIAEDE